MLLSTASTDGRLPACGVSACTKDKTKKNGNGHVSGLLIGRLRRGIGIKKNRSITRIPGNASSKSAASDRRLQLAARGDSSCLAPPSTAPVDGGESDDNEYGETSSAPDSKVLHNDRAIHSIGCRERKFIGGMLTRLHLLGFVTRNDLHCFGTILCIACNWERPFFNLLVSEDGRTSTMRVDPLWACVERLLLRGRDDDANGNAPDGPTTVMTQSLVKNSVLDVLWGMGIDLICGDTVGVRKGNAYVWNTLGCCQCSLFPTL